MRKMYSFEIVENPDKEVGHSQKWLRLCYMCHGNAFNPFAPVVLLGPSGPWLR